LNESSTVVGLSYLSTTDSTVTVLRHGSASGGGMSGVHPKNTTVSHLLAKDAPDCEDHVAEIRDSPAVAAVGVEVFCEFRLLHELLSQSPPSPFITDGVINSSNGKANRAHAKCNETAKTEYIQKGRQHQLLLH